MQIRSIVLDDGRMAGIGTHKELMKNCEVYRQIAMSQLSEEGIGMSEQRRRKGPMGGRGIQPTEKAKDFKGAMAKLFRYMGRYKFRFMLMLVFAVAGTVFNIVGPERSLEKQPQSFIKDWLQRLTEPAELILRRSE